MTYKFDHLDRTGLTEAEVLKRARQIRRAAPFKMGMQEAIDWAISAAAEHAQG